MNYATVQLLTLFLQIFTLPVAFLRQLLAAL